MLFRRQADAPLQHDRPCPRGLDGPPTPGIASPHPDPCRRSLGPLIRGPVDAHGRTRKATEERNKAWDAKMKKTTGVSAAVADQEAHRTICGRGPIKPL